MYIPNTERKPDQPSGYKLEQSKRTSEKESKRKQQETNVHEEDEIHSPTSDNLYSSSRILTFLIDLHISYIV